MTSITNKFKDNTAAISYKETNCNGIPNKKDINHKLIEARWSSITQYILLHPEAALLAREKNAAYSQEGYENLSLENRDNRWFIKNNLHSFLTDKKSDDNLYAPEVNKHYIFVTMPDNIIRVAKYDTPEYRMLFQYARYARYAAEGYFDDNGTINFSNQLSYKDLTLINRNNQWFIKDNLNASLADTIDEDSLYLPEPDTLYIFVVMPDNTTRIAKRATHGHLLLSDYSKYVKYAGEICFNEKGDIKFWNNNSLSYAPAPLLAEQANFTAHMQKFRLVIDRNDPARGRTNAFNSQAAITEVAALSASAAKQAIASIALTQVAEDNNSLQGSDSRNTIEDIVNADKSNINNNLTCAQTASKNIGSFGLWTYRPPSPITPDTSNETSLTESTTQTELTNSLSM